jgi:hypothetical protein
MGEIPRPDGIGVQSHFALNDDPRHFVRPLLGLCPTNIWQILRTHGRGKPRPYNALRAGLLVVWSGTQH